MEKCRQFRSFRLPVWVCVYLERRGSTDDQYYPERVKQRKEGTEKVNGSGDGASESARQAPARRLSLFSYRLCQTKKRKAFFRSIASTTTTTSSSTTTSTLFQATDMIPTTGHWLHKGEYFSSSCYLFPHGPTEMHRDDAQNIEPRRKDGRQFTWIDSYSTCPFPSPLWLRL